MLNGQKVIAIIPARGGSKGIPGKNLYQLGGKSLLERTIELAERCPFVDQALVSTDDPEMYGIAQRLNAAAPSFRPAELATDSASTIDVIFHLIEENQLQDCYLLLLQVTTPLRTSEDLNGLFAEFQKNDSTAKSIVSMTELKGTHPNKTQVIKDGYVHSYLEGESMVARQSLPKVYALNGAFYLTHIDTFKTNRSFFSSHTLPFLMPEERSINLDTKMDLFLLEALIEKGIVSPD